MKKVLLPIGLLVSTFIGAQDCSDLFISEYVEGWSNNKALEIYNPTDQPIDLSEYIIIRYSNGSAFAGPEAGVVLQGMLQPYDVHVAVLDKRDPNGTGQEAPVWTELQDKADAFYCNNYNVSKAMYFNGNDAVVLAKGGLDDISTGKAEFIDVFGKIRENPDLEDGHYDGWTTEYPYFGVGVVVTTDHSLIRKPEVKKGVTENPDFFNALAEWDTLPPVIPRLDENGNPIYNQQGNLSVVGNWESLGSHECDCNPLSIDKEVESIKLSVYPNPSINGKFELSALNKIVKVEVYNSVGQKVFSQLNPTGIQVIDVGSQSGVYLMNIKTESGVVSSRRIVVQ